MDDHDTLVLYAHGSRDPRWRSPFEALEVSLGGTLGRDRVILAYQQKWKPDLRAAAEQARAGGARRIHLLPLFLSGSTSTENKILEQVKAVRAQFPDLPIDLMMPLYEDPRLFQVIEEIIRSRVG